MWLVNLADGDLSDCELNALLIIDKSQYHDTLKRLFCRPGDKKFHFLRVIEDDTKNQAILYDEPNSVNERQDASNRT